MAIPILNHLDLRSVSELQNAILHTTTHTEATNKIGAFIYDTGSDTLKYCTGTNNGDWISLTGTDANTMGSGFVIEDDSDVEVTITENKEVKIIGAGLTTLWTDVSNGTDGDPYDLTLTIDAAQTGITSIYNTGLKVGRASGTEYIDFATDNKVIIVSDSASYRFIGTGVLPGTDNARALGSTAKQWSDLFIGTGGVINFHSGDMTVTHSANTLTVAGGTLAATFSGALSGNATTATALATSRTIGMTGDVNWTSAAFDGSGNVTGTSVIQANAVEGSMLNNNIVSGLTDIGAAIVSTDEVIVSDAGTIRRSDVSRLQTYMQSALTFTTNTDINTNVANLTARLPQITESVTIGDGLDVTVTIAGNLVVNGSNTTVASTTVAVGDNMFQFAKDNTANSVDIGWYGKAIFSGNQTKYPGIWYDASEDTNTGTTPKFKVGTATTEPGNTATVVTKGTVVADLEGNADTATNLTASTSIAVPLGTIELGHASDTTIARSGAGVVTIEGAEVRTGTVAIAKGGTGQTAALAAFNALKQPATDSYTGVVELATDTEVKEGAGASKMVDATQLGARSVYATIDSSAMAATSGMKAEIRHNLGTEDVTVELFEKTSKTTVYAEIKREEYDGTDATNYITIYFSAEPSEDIEVIIQSHDGAAAAAAVAYA